MSEGNGVLVDEETIQSVGHAAHGLEGARRAGWAKAFDAERRADSAERDVNMLRSDNLILSKFAARIYGALEVLAGRCRTDELFRGDNHELKGFLPQDALNKGRDAGRRLLGKQTDELNHLRAEIAAAKAELHEWIVKSHRLEIGRLCKKFNIPSEEALMEWLGRYEEHP